MSDFSDLIAEAKEKTQGRPSCNAVLIALVIGKGFDELVSAINEGLEALPDIETELKGVRIAAEDMKP